MRFVEWVHENARRLDQPPVGAPALGPADMAKLTRSLRQCLKQNEIYFQIAFGLAVLLMLCTVVSAFLGHDKSSTLWMQGMFGVSSFGAVTFALSRAKEKQSFELMVELAVGLDEDAVREVLRVLTKKYAGTDSPVPLSAASPVLSRLPTRTGLAEPGAVRLWPSVRDATPTRPSLRSLLETILITNEDFDAYCLDYFRPVHQRFASGMDRKEKCSKLLEQISCREILEKLTTAYPERVASYQHLLQWEPPGPSNN